MSHSKIPTTLLFILNLAPTFLVVKGDLDCRGYDNCPKSKDGFLNVHLIPHSHDDLGWLKTVQQYYNGEKNEIQEADVRSIINSVLDQLQQDKSRRFIYVETGFLWRWWTENNDTQRQVMTQLVQSGQLEFINGGWTMNDEACAHYSSIIDQMTLGLRFLNNTFASCGHPTVAWQIDPFGHSQEMAAIFAQMGFNGLFIGRLDLNDKAKRLKEKNMEFVWSGNSNLGKETSLFTSILYNSYQPPEGFCFGERCGWAQETVDGNLEGKVTEFLKVVQLWATSYKSQNTLMSMGSDFHYTKATMWYNNLDKLINRTNARQSKGSKVNVFYSTPSCYLQQLHRSNLTWLTKFDDFFPYADAQNDFWTGFYTSRPSLKYYVRKASNFLAACKQLGGITEQGSIEEIFELEEPLAIAQHHDAISGTARQHVTDDYVHLISVGMDACQSVVSASLKKIEVDELLKRKRKLQDVFQFCHEFNISACAASETQTDYMVAIYNPLAWEISNFYVRVPISHTNIAVQNALGPIKFEVLPIPQTILKIPGRQSTANHELLFRVESVPGLSFVNFKVTKTKMPTIPAAVKIETKDFLVNNSAGVILTFGGNGLLKKIKVGKSEMEISQNFYYYKARSADYKGSASGAYIFRPHGNDPVVVSSKINFTVTRGAHVTEVHQTFNNWLSQIIRLYDKLTSVEFQWLVGPIPVEDGIGKEVITRFRTKLKTNKIFYTDANGRQLLRRERNKRATWAYKPIEPIAGNYYPVTSRLIMTEGKKLIENKKTLILLNDRSQGGSSIYDGELELMLHRRLLNDDARGLDEALNEQAFGIGLVASGKIQMVFAGDKTGIPTSIHRKMAHELYWDKIIGFRDLAQIVTDEIFGAGTKFSQLGSVLPPNCHLLSLGKVSETEFLMRLENFYEKNEDKELSKTAVISLRKLKDALAIATIRETTLGANKWLDETTPRFDWKTSAKIETIKFQPLNYSIILEPMQIRSFIFTIFELDLNGDIVTVTSTEPPPPSEKVKKFKKNWRQPQNVNIFKILHGLKYDKPNMREI